jgi:manganese transport protein
VYGEDKVDTLLVLSQVILSLQLGFAIIPLIHFVSDKSKMGNFAINNITKIAAWVIAATLIALNLKMLLNEAANIFTSPALFPKIAVIVFGLLFMLLLVYIIIHPIIVKNREAASIKIHPEITMIKELIPPLYNRIAIALDFSENDEKLIAYAIGQGNKNSRYFLIHVVESASASLLGRDSNDYETKADSERLNSYVKQLELRNLQVEGHLGFNHRSVEIVKLVKKLEADMLIVGAHRHTGLKDIIYGETVNTVRHELDIPILIVNV